VDINDYYSFEGISGDLLLAEIDGPNGVIGQLLKEDGSGNPVVLVEEQITGGNPILLEYFPNNFHPGETFYLRIYSPDGVPSGPYDFNVTRVEFDKDNGYYKYATELESGQDIVITNPLGPTNTNDWYHFKLRSGEYINITLDSTMPDPHVGMKVFSGFFQETLDDGQSLNFSYVNYFFVVADVYIQVVNEAKTPGEYTIDIDFTLIDNDNNGTPEIAEDLPVENPSNTDELSLSDINDFYVVNVKSGYNLTINFETTGFTNLPIYLIFWNEEGNIMLVTVGNKSSLTYSNPGFDSKLVYIQFYNYANLVYPGNVTACEGTYQWNATLVNNDPDGDFEKAQPISGPTANINDQLFANITFPTFNISDINDFYSIDLNAGDVLSLSITITGVSNPWFSVHIYDHEYNLLKSEQGSDSYELLFSAGGFAGTYYIRFYNNALKGGNYLMALAQSNDPDSYFDGATPVEPGEQDPDDMSNVDINDFYEIQMESGWRMKVNATVSGTDPNVNLFIYDPDETAIIGDIVGVNYLEVVFSAEKSGLYYIQFQNENGTAVDYNWWIQLYEDENGVFETATPLPDGDFDDEVHELDVYDYFVIEGQNGVAFTITCSLPAGLNLELYLYDKDQNFIDADTTVPGLALTYTPSADESFYVLFENPGEETGAYSFTVEGAGEPTITPTDTETTTGINFFNRELLGLKYWLWAVIIGGALIGIIVVIVIIVAVTKKKKAPRTR
jgi:hypothetical protein